MASPVAISRAHTDELAEVNGFYASLGYQDGARRGDRLWLARRESQVLGAVRLCPHPEGYILLRGLYVAPEVQRQGLGSQLVRAALADVAGRVCYCLPFAPLEGFYKRLKFGRIRPEHAPQQVATRLRCYLDEGLEVILMRRMPVYDC